MHEICAIDDARQARGDDTVNGPVQNSRKAQRAIAKLAQQPVEQIGMGRFGNPQLLKSDPRRQSRRDARENGPFQNCAEVEVA